MSGEAPRPCRCLKQMEQDGLELQDLFSQLALEDRERQAILSAVHKALPDFRPPPPPQTPLGRCSAQLLADFYTGVSPPWAEQPGARAPLQHRQGGSSALVSLP